MAPAAGCPIGRLPNRPRRHVTTTSTVGCSICSRPSTPSPTMRRYSLRIKAIFNQLQWAAFNQVPWADEERWRTFIKKVNSLVCRLPGCSRPGAAPVPALERGLEAHLSCELDKLPNLNKDEFCHMAHMMPHVFVGKSCFAGGRRRRLCLGWLSCWQAPSTLLVRWMLVYSLNELSRVRCS